MRKRIVRKRRTHKPARRFFDECDELEWEDWMIGQPSDSSKK